MTPDREPRAPFTSHDIVAAAVLVWGLGLGRVAGALLRHEPPSREADVAWLIVLFVPILLWKEVAA